jgi:hypothetical protein
MDKEPPVIVTVAVVVFADTAVGSEANNASAQIVVTEKIALVLIGNLITGDRPREIPFSP